MTSDEQEYGEDEKEHQRFLTIRSREKIEEYMKNRDRSKFLLNF
jgi:predicted P-loop ATPase